MRKGLKFAAPGPRESPSGFLPVCHPLKGKGWKRRSCSAVPFSWRPTLLASATTRSVASFARTRSRCVRLCVYACACHSSSRTIPHPRGYSRWQRLIIPRKVHPPIIVGRRRRRRHFGIVTDSSLLRYYYEQPAPFLDWHVTRAFTSR